MSHKLILILWLEFVIKNNNLMQWKPLLWNLEKKSKSSINSDLMIIKWTNEENIWKWVNFDLVFVPINMKALWLLCEKKGSCYLNPLLFGKLIWTQNHKLLIARKHIIVTGPNPSSKNFRNGINQDETIYLWNGTWDRVVSILFYPEYMCIFI